MNTKTIREEVYKCPLCNSKMTVKECMSSRHDEPVYIITYCSVCGYPEIPVNQDDIIKVFKEIAKKANLTDDDIKKIIYRVRRKDDSHEA